MNNINVLVDAKKEYTKQLISIFTPTIYMKIKNMYEKAKNINDENNNSRGILFIFQNLLSNIPKWNKVFIEQEYKNLKKISDCDFLEELISAVFIAQTKILSSIKLDNKKGRKINLKIPSGNLFLHKCFIECARAFWKNPFLYYDVDIDLFNIQRNLRDSEELIGKSIYEAIRKMMPVNNILKEYINAGSKTINKLNMNSEQKNILRNVVKNEIKNIDDDNYSHFSLNEEEYKIEKDKLESEKLEKDKLEKEKLEKEKERRDRYRLERLESEKLEIEKLEKDKLEKEKLEKDKLEKEKLENERRDRKRLERLESEKLESEKLEKDKLEKEKLEKEKERRDRYRLERLESEKLEIEKLEKDKLEKEKLEKDKLEKDKLEKDKLEKEKLENEQLEDKKIIKITYKNKNETYDLNSDEEQNIDTIVEENVKDVLLEKDEHKKIYENLNLII